MSMGSGDHSKTDMENGPPIKQEKEATKKIIRVLTVLAYLSSVSTAAIMLSLYYIFLWNPMPSNAAQTMPSDTYTATPLSTVSPDVGKPDVKLAGTESKDKMYEPKHKKKLVRVLTVVAYVFSVSLAAITLSLFYIFIYNPDRPAGKLTPPRGYHYYNNSNALRPDDDRLMNRTWLAPEEPRALPVQIGQPPKIHDDISYLNSDESVPNDDMQEIRQTMRGKRSTSEVLQLLKLVNLNKTV